MHAEAVIVIRQLSYYLFSPKNGVDYWYARSQSYFLNRISTKDKN